MGVKICPKCGGKVSDHRNDCVHCGYVFLTTKTCPDCGEEIDANLEECPICGYPFKEPVKEETKVVETTHIDIVPSIEETNEEILDTIEETQTPVEESKQEEVIIAPREVEVIMSSSDDLSCPYCGEHDLMEIGNGLFICNTCKGRFLDTGDHSHSIPIQENESPTIVEVTDSEEQLSSIGKQPVENEAEIVSTSSIINEDNSNQGTVSQNSSHLIKQEKHFETDSDTDTSKSQSFNTEVSSNNEQTATNNASPLNDSKTLYTPPIQKLFSVGEIASFICFIGILVFGIISVINFSYDDDGGYNFHPQQTCILIGLILTLAFLILYILWKIFKKRFEKKPLVKLISLATIGLLGISGFGLVVVFGVGMLFFWHSKLFPIFQIWLLIFDVFFWIILIMNFFYYRLLDKNYAE